MLLERQGVGLAHARLRQETGLTEADIVTYLAHSRVTEQRASEQMALLLKYFADHPEIGKAVRAIARDEDNHLAYCHEELLRLCAQGHRRTIERILRECALAEIRTYRDVSLAVMASMGRVLGWPAPKRAALAAGVHAVYLYERAYGWRRMVTLSMPARRNALGGPAVATA
jgi:hypothetical protein